MAEGMREAYFLTEDDRQRQEEAPSIAPGAFLVSPWHRRRLRHDTDRVGALNRCAAKRRV